LTLYLQAVIFDCFNIAEYHCIFSLLGKYTYTSRISVEH